jgi:hypothetical protein
MLKYMKQSEKTLLLLKKLLLKTQKEITKNSVLKDSLLNKDKKEFKRNFKWLWVKIKAKNDL